MIATGLLVLLVAATAGVQSAAATALQSTLDAHWRGAYDILVTAKKATVGDLLPPNALSGGGGRMSLADVDRVRALAGVDVAAPLAQVIVPTLEWGRIELAAPVDATAAEPDFEGYRLTVRYITDDGLGERLAHVDEYRLVLDRSSAPLDIPLDASDWSQGTCFIGEVEVTCGEPPAAAWTQRATWELSGLGEGGSQLSYNQGSTSGDTVRIGLPQALSEPARVALVDPVAERALLGDGGAFLDPLIQLGDSRPTTIELAAWSAEHSGAPFASTIDTAVTQRATMLEQTHASDSYQDYLRIMAERGEAPQSDAELFPDAQYIPILVAKRAPTALRVEIGVEGLGPASPLVTYGPSAQQALPTDGAPLGSMRADLSELLTPFSAAVLTIPWLGQSTPSLQTNGPWLNGGVANAFMQSLPPSVSRAQDGTLSLTPKGYLLPLDAGASTVNGRISALLPDGTRVGTQAAYSSIGREQGLAGSDGAWAQFLPVGDLGALDQARHPPGDVPLGAYESNDVSLVTDAHGDSVEPIDVLSGAGGLGLAGARTDAVADLGLLVGSTDEDLVDAIRVRVADVDAYDAGGIARVEAVADGVRSLGLAATIVAGSSPETVRIHVDGYAFGTMDDAGSQKVGPLGTVEQTWTRLGAAAHLSTAISQATTTLIAIVVGASLALYAIITFSATGSRRHRASTLRAAGWTRWRISRWILADHVPAIVVVGFTGVIAGLLAAERALTAQVSASLVLGIVIIAVVAALTGSRVTAPRVAGLDELRERPTVRWQYDGEPDKLPARRLRLTRIGAMNPGGFGVRLARADARGSIFRVASVLVVMVAAAGSVVAVDAGRSAGGTTRLAEAAFATAFIPQVLIGLVGVLSGVGMLWLLQSSATRRRTASLHILRETGWTARDLEGARRAEILATALPAALVGSYAIWFALGAAHVASPEAAVSASLVAGLASVAVLLFRPRPRGSAER